MRERVIQQGSGVTSEGEMRDFAGIELIVRPGVPPTQRHYQYVSPYLLIVTIVAASTTAVSASVPSR